MKYIFDFDDVLFNNTKQFKEHMFKLITEAGVPEAEARAYYAKPEVRGKEFSLKKFIKTLFSTYDVDIKETPVDDIYQRIMQESRKFLNLDLVELAKRVGLENCYIVTNGEREFNTDKLKYTGIWDLFGGEKRIQIVPGNKREAILKICAEPRKEGEKVIFIDDKQTFLNEVKDVPDLISIPYKNQSSEELMSEINRVITQNATSAELKRRK